MASEYKCPCEFNSDESMTKMFLKHIPKDQTDDQLKEAFAEYNVKSATIVKKENSEQEFCFGFVIFEKCDDLDECLLKRDEIEKKTKYQGLKRAVPKEDGKQRNALYRTKKLFIGNVSAELTEDIVKEYINQRHGKYGEVESVTLMKKKNEKGELTEENKGFGFIAMKSEDMVDRIHNAEKEAEIIPGNEKKQQIKRSQPRGDGFQSRGGGGGRGGYHQHAGQQHASAYGAAQFGGYAGGYHPYGAYGWGPMITDPYLTHMRYGPY